jgi:23S rRNA A1618 N6-methylase RlmF
MVRMVEGSEALRNRVGWFRSILARLSSAEAVAGKLKEVGVSSW